LDEAHEILWGIDLNHIWTRGMPLPWYFRTRASYLKSHYEEMLAGARQGLEVFPGNWHLLRHEIVGLILTGQAEAAVALATALERMDSSRGSHPGEELLMIASELAHAGFQEAGRDFGERAIEWCLAQGRHTYRGTLAEAHLFLSQPEDALPLIEALFEQDPENLRFHGLHGVALAQAGDPEAAEAESKWLAEVRIPYVRGENTAWRASITAYLGEKDEAVELLRQAFDEGLHWWMLHYPWRNSPLWGYPPYEQFVQPRIDRAPHRATENAGLQRGPASPR
jgi:tetratricopeptide (TPR) repeat protein